MKLKENWTFDSLIDVSKLKRTLLSRELAKSTFFDYRIVHYPKSFNLSLFRNHGPFILDSKVKTSSCLDQVIWPKLYGPDQMDLYHIDNMICFYGL